VRPVLVVNSGSSSLKYQVVDVDTEQSLLQGLIERVSDHGEAFLQMVADLNASGIKPVAIGHRVVHGGARFSEPTLLDETVIQEIEKLVTLAPLHNPGNLAGIRGAIKAYPTLPQIAVFDTAFHQSMPKSSYSYAIDASLSERYGIRKYGFHGSSHAFVSKAASKFLNKKSFTGIVLHLGNGGSACAVKDGKSINTSMGMTPLQGLVMGTRAGDIDPAIILHLNLVAGMSIEEIDQSLNKDSGLKGLTGDSDLRDVQARAANCDEIAITALEIYALRIKHYIGAYLAQLGEIDALVFTAGVGENSAQMREQVCSGLEHLGLEIDPVKNAERSKAARDISTETSRIRVLVIPTNEELEIALAAVSLSEQAG
jgi:acetate kinase